MAVNYTSPIEMTHFDSLSLDPVNYQGFNNYGLEWPCSMLKIVNDSYAQIFVSYDGTTDHDYVGANGTMDLLFQLNSQPNGHVSKASTGLIVYIRGSVPKFGGWIYLIGHS